MKNGGIITPQKANDLLPEEYQETLPEEMQNPQKFQMQQMEQNMEKKTAKEPSLDRIKTGRDKRVPKAQREGKK